MAVVMNYSHGANDEHIALLNKHPCQQTLDSAFDVPGSQAWEGKRLAVATRTRMQRLRMT